jgi:hypothetical protein
MPRKPTNKTRSTVTRNGRNVRVYRAIMEDYLGRELAPDEHVHHINGNYQDNRIENLQIVSASEHRRIHGPSNTTQCTPVG